MSEEKIIQECCKNNHKAQQALYDIYASKMFPVCRRYLKNTPEAEDALMEGFYKVFSKIKTFQKKGSFEGWIKRIIVNECLMMLRKKQIIDTNVELPEYQLTEPSSSGLEQLMEADVLALLDELPAGYRTVFNLYVVEGYKHREIAEQLDISINTSKSQLILAKKKLIKALENIQHPRF